MDWLLAQELLNQDNNNLELAIQQSFQQSQELQSLQRNQEYDPNSIKMTIETYDKTKHINTCCPITFEDFIDKETVVATLECKHCFKEEFIKRWLREKPECPVCRFKLECQEKSTVEEDTAFFLNSIHILANMRNYNTRTTHAERERENNALATSTDVDAEIEIESESEIQSESESESENYDPNADYLDDFRLV